MGTRGLIGFKVDGKYSGYYNQYDSYPEGMGFGIVEFIKNRLLTKDNVDTMKRMVSNLEVVNSSNDPTLEDLSFYAEFHDKRVSNGKDWYSLLRNLQGEKCLDAILDYKLHHMFDDMKFINDSLFCEYAYFLNFDNYTLELYEGFQKQDQLLNPFGNEKNNHGYYPCRHVLSIPFGFILQRETKFIVGLMKVAMSNDQDS